MEGRRLLGGAAVGHGVGMAIDGLAVYGLERAIRELLEAGPLLGQLGGSVGGQIVGGLGDVVVVGIVAAVGGQRGHRPRHDYGSEHQRSRQHACGWRMRMERVSGGRLCRVAVEEMVVLVVAVEVGRVVAEITGAVVGLAGRSAVAMLLWGPGGARIGCAAAGTARDSLCSLACMDGGIDGMDSTDAGLQSDSSSSSSSGNGWVDGWISGCVCAS